MPNKKKLYEALKQEGYTNFADEKAFNDYVSDANNRKTLFNALKEEGYENFADETEFDDYLGYSAPVVSTANPPTSGGVGTQEEADSIFDANMKRFQEGQPIERVGVNKSYEYKPEVQQHILENKPDIFKSNKASLMDKPLGIDAEEGSNEKFGARINVAQKNAENPEIQKARTSAHLRGLSTSVDEELTSIEERINARRNAIRNENWRPGMPSSRDDRELAELRGQRTYLEGAKELIEESQQIVDAANKENDGTFFGGLGRGVRDTAFDLDNWTMGLSDLVGNLRLKSVLEKAEKGEELSKAEETLLGASVNNMAVNYYYGSDLGRGYKAGQITGESLPFMLEMIANPIAGSGNAIAKNLLKYGLKKFGNATTSNAAKFGGRLVGDAIAASGMAATTGMPAVLGDAVKRTNENYDYNFDDDGNLKVQKVGDTTFGEALGKSFATRAIENQSEMIFNAFGAWSPLNPIARSVGDALPDGVKGFINRIKNLKPAEWYREIKNNPTLREIAQRTQFHGLPEEYFEEVYNNFANVALGEMTMDEVLDLDSNIDTFIGLAPTSVAFGMVGLGGMAVERYKNRKKLESIFGRMTDEQKAKLKELQEMGKLQENVDIREFIKATMADESLTPEQKREEIEYAYEVAKNNAMNEVTEAETVDAIEAQNAAIDAATDPQTGMYGEVELKRFDESGEEVHVAANVFGEKIVNGELYLLVQEEGSDKKDWVKPSQYYPETYQSMPAEEVKAETTEIIREEAEQKMAEESKYAPEVINAQMQQNVPFETADALYIPVQPMLEGNGWEVEVYGKDENGKPAKTPIVEEMTNDAYRDLLQQQYEQNEAAQEEASKVEAANQAIVNNMPSKAMNDGTGRILVPTAVQGDEVAYNLTDAEGNVLEQASMKSDKFNEIEDAVPVNESVAQPETVQEGTVEANPIAETGETVPGEEVPQPQAKQQTPTIPTKKDGSIDFVSYGKDNTFNMLGDKYGEKMPRKVEVTAKAYAEDLKKAQQKLDKAEEDYDNAPIGREDKAEKARDKAREEFDAVKREADFWAQLDREIKAAKVKPGEAVAEEILSMEEPLSGEEFAAQMLANGNIKLLQGSFAEETGFGKEEISKYFGLFASADKGGMSVSEAGERLMEADRENGTNFFDQNDPNAGRNALIEVLGMAQTRGDLAKFIKNNRVEQAKREKEAEYAAYEAWVEENFHMSVADYEAYEEVIARELAERGLTEEDNQEFMSTFVDETLNTVEDGQQRINSESEGGGEVLPDAQSIPTGRTSGIAEESAEVDGGVTGENGAVLEGAPGREVKAQIEQARAEVEQNPTEAQKEAGNYKKGHVKIDGFDISIENPKGGVRSGVDKNGKKWSITMNNDYGYIRGTEAVDGDHIDVFLSDNPTEGRVFVVDQTSEDGSFDESKVMYGFNSLEEARAAYLSNYEKGWENRIMAITEVSKDEFKKWIDSSHRKTKAFSEYKGVRVEEEKPYTIESATYTTKKGKELDMHLVKFNQELTKGIKSAANGLAKELKGWWDREKDGFMMRSEEDAKQLAEYVADAQSQESVSMDDIQAVNDGDVVFTEPQQPKEQPKDEKPQPVWQYSVYVDKESGRTTLRREDVSGVIPVGDARFTVTADSPQEMLDILRNPQNGMQEVLDAVGVTLENKVKTRELDRKVKETPKNNPNGNKLVSDERYAELRERMRKKLGGQMNMGIDPEILAIGTEMAVYHIEKGARKFAEYAQAMIADLGDAIRPYLKAFYNGARDLPEMQSEGLTSDMTPYEEVSAFDLANFDQPSVDVIATAETIVKEQEVAQQAEVAKERVKKQRNPKKKSKETVSLLGDLFNQNVETNEESTSQQSGRPGTAGNQTANGVVGSEAREEGSGTSLRGEAGSVSGHHVSDETRGRRVHGVSGQSSVKQNANNFSFGEGHIEVPSGDIAKLKANIEAIRTLKEIEASGQPATDAQKKKLSKYVGWGGLSAALDAEKARYQYDRSWNEKYLPYYKQLQELLTKEEFNDAVQSTNTSHYTPEEVIRGMWKVVEQLGFKGGRINEPAAGVGHILGLMPQSISERSDISGTELDSLSGRIAKSLYPDAAIKVQGYETEFAPKSKDLVITNVPFGKTAPYDKALDKALRKKMGSAYNLHNYFIAKGLLELKEGGIGVFVTSSATMDGANSRFREWVAANGIDLVGAVRLPNDAFLKNAGTSVTADMLVFRKRKAGESSNGVNFVSTTQIGEGTYQEAGEMRTKPIMVNEYFAEHPDMMLGEMMTAHDAGSGGLYSGASQTCVAKKGANLAEELNDAIGRLGSAGVDLSESQAAVEASGKVRATDLKNGTLVVEGNEVLVSINGELQPVESKKDFTYNGKKQKTADAVRDYNELKETLKSLIKAEQSANENPESLRKKLNQQYDAFVTKYGTLNRNKALDNVLAEDFEHNLPLSLESVKRVPSATGKSMVWEVKKGEGILSKRVSYPVEEPTKAENVEDAIHISRSYRGVIDIPYVASLTGKTEAEVTEEMLQEGVAYRDPLTGDLVDKESYLSGNVKEKLEQARAMAEEHPEYQKNVEDLMEVQPETVRFGDISYRIGTPWIPTQYVNDFALDVLGIRNVEVNYVPSLNEFVMSGSARVDDFAKAGQYKTDKLSVIDLLEYALNQRKPKIVDKKVTYGPTGRVEERIPNEAETQAAAEKIMEISDKFIEYIDGRNEIHRELERIYNDKYNNYRLKQYEAPSFEHYPNSNAEITLRDHQKKAVQRALSESTLLAHQVGTGKTFTMITTAMEMRRLGIAKKPMIVVQNATLEDFVKDFYELYPGANVLVPGKDERSAENRKRLFNLIATGDFDAIVIPQSFMQFIPDDEGRKKELIQKRIDEYEQSIGNINDYSIRRRMQKEIEALRNSLEGKEKKRSVKDKAKAADRIKSKMERQLDRRTDDVLTFEQMGVDALFIDEAHNFKKIGFASKMSNVKGIDTSASQRANSLLLKAQYVQEKNGGRNVILATGTPITNTMAEVWTMMKFVSPDILEDYNIQSFDDFATTFGTVEPSLEFTATGNFKIADRFKSYVNVPELVKAFRSHADVVLTSDVKEFKENNKIPKLKNDQMTNVVIEKNEDLEDVMDVLIKKLEEYNDMSGSEKREWSALPLVVFSRAKQAAIDLRLLNPKYEDNPNSKTNHVVRNVLQLYKESTADKGTQLVFCDSYQSPGEAPKMDLFDFDPDVPRFNLYEDIKAKLVAGGIPANEIAIVNNYDGERRKQLFEKVRNGDVRVLLGSTEKMGVGVNVQDRLYALHHIDAPIRPMDFEQRNGRILRQGNLYAEWGKPVNVVTYGVQGTLDATAYDRLRIKQDFINQMMKGDVSGRVMEEQDEEDPSGMTFNQMAATLSGDKTAQLLFVAENDLKKLRNLKRSDFNSKSGMGESIQIEERKLVGLNDKLELWGKATETVKKYFPEGVKDVKVNGQTFTEKLGVSLDPVIENYEEAYSLNRGTSPLKLSLNNGNAEVIVHFDEGRMVYELYAGKEHVVESRQFNGGKGLMSSIEHQLKSTEKNYEETKQKIAESKKKIQGLEKAMKAPWGREDELKAAEQKVADLKKQMEEKAAQNTKGTPVNESDDTLYRNVDSVDSINDRFNEELQQQIDGTLPKGHVYQLGMPSEVLKSTGVQMLPIRLQASVLNKKSNDKNHPFGLSEIKDLVKLIQKPIAIFEYGDKSKAQNLMIGLSQKDAEGKQFLVGLSLNPVVNGKALEINSVRNVFPKNFHDWIHWINQGKVLRIDNKEEIQNIINALRINPVDYIDDNALDSATKIVENFENPSVEGENLFRTVYHGSGAEFGKFDHSFMGTGEGTQVYGWGTYVTPSKRIAIDYADAAVSRQYRNDKQAQMEDSEIFWAIDRRHLYEVEIPDDNGSNYIRFDLPLPEGQKRTIREAMLKNDSFKKYADKYGEEMAEKRLDSWLESQGGGGRVYDFLQNFFEDAEQSDKAVSQFLSDAGFVGISVPTNFKNEYGDHSQLNYVIFKEEDAKIKEHTRFRAGEGTLTADEVSMANDPLGSLLGESTRTPRQQKSFAERERKRMVERVESLAKKLRLNNVEIVTDASTLSGAQRKAKGFYSKSKRKITIVIPNHSSVFDVEQTLLHEAVAHYGLRELFGAQFDVFLDNVYRNASREVRDRINQMAMRNGWDFPTATEEYLATLAEDTNFDEVQESWWSKIKHYFLQMLHSIGFENFSGVTLDDNELRYILWRSYQNLAEPGRYRSILGEAADIVMQDKLKVGNYNQSRYERERERLMNTGKTRSFVAESDASYNKAEQVEEFVEEFTAMYDSKPVHILDENVLDEDVRKWLGLDDITAEELIDWMDEQKVPAAHARLTDNIIIFAGRIKPEKVEETLFHEHLHVLLNAGAHKDLVDNFYQKAKNDERFAKWKKMSDKEQYNDNERPEEFFAYVISNAQVDGDFEGVFAHLSDNEQKELSNLLNQLGYEIESEKASRSRRGRRMAVRNPNAESLAGRETGEAFRRETGGEHKEASDVRNGSVGAHTGEGQREEVGDVLYRTSQKPGNKLGIRDEYEALIKQSGYQAREAVQDFMLSLRRVQEMIEKASGKKLRDFENAWMHENRLSSTVQAEIHEFEKKYYKPMMSAVKNLMTSMHTDNEAEVADYLMLKHQIERNREMAVRKALTNDDGSFDRDLLKMWYDEKRAIRNDENLPTWREKQEAMDAAALNYGADMSRDYSGLTSMFETDDLAECTERAYDEVEELENLRPAETEALNKAVKAMNQRTLDTAFESGLMSKDVHEELKNDMYDYYVPLRGFEETTSDEVYAYLDNERGAFNAPLRRAKGRTSKSDSPLAYMKSIGESGIMQGNRNKMKQTFLNMVLNNPTDLVSVKEGVWAIYNPASGEWEAASFPDSKIPRNATPADVEAAYEQWEADMEQQAANDPNIKKIRESADVPYRVVGNKMNQHQVIVRRLGRSYTLTVNGNPRLAMALNGLTNPNNTSNDGKVAAYVSGKIDAMNRQLSAWYTTRNPDFVASNFMRDTFYTNTIVRAKEGNKYANKFHKHYAELLMPGRMMKLFNKYENGTLDPSKPMEKDFMDFMMNGGETGYSNLKDLEHIKKQIAKDVKKGKRREQIDAMIEKADLLNRAVENTSRFAAYLTSREMGRSIAKSVFDAKEISVNFNKKGAGGTFFGATGQTKFGNLAAMTGAGGRAMYVFFNAAIQGTTNLMHVARVNPVGTSAGIASMFLMGALIPFLLDDDDEKDYYDIPEYVRRSHLIVPGTGDAWISIPLPIEYRIMYGMGELLTSWRTGHERGSDIARKMLNLTGQALPLNFMEEGVDAFVPSVISPLWQTYNNKSWTGLPIYKDTEWNKDDPEYTKAFKNADRNLVKLTKGLYEWTFDEENQREGVNLNPAVIEHIANGYFSGFFKTMSNVAKTASMVQGEREFDWRNVPVANRVFKTGDEQTKNKRVQNEYFENMERMDFLQARKRLLKKTAEGAAVPDDDKRKAEEEYKILTGSDVYKDYEEFNGCKKQADKIRKALKTTVSPELEKRLYEVMEKANETVR